jgi:hypothetical protein
MTNDDLISLAIRDHCDTFRDCPTMLRGEVSESRGETYVSVIDRENPTPPAATYIVTEPGGLRLFTLPEPRTFFLPVLGMLLIHATDLERLNILRLVINSGQATQREGVATLRLATALAECFRRVLDELDAEEAAAVAA